MNKNLLLIVVVICLFFLAIVFKEPMIFIAPVGGFFIGMNLASKSISNELSEDLHSKDYKNEKEL